MLPKYFERGLQVLRIKLNSSSIDSEEYYELVSKLCKMVINNDNILPTNNIK